MTRTRTAARAAAAAATLAPLTLLLAGCGGDQALPARPAAVTVSTALARSPAAAAGLVAGFPTGVLPAPPGATVAASAIEPQCDLVQISLAGSSPATAAAILDFYRSALAGEGFTASDGSVLPPGATGMAYSRDDGRELVVVAVVDRGATRSFSVGGTIRG